MGGKGKNLTDRKRQEILRKSWKKKAKRTEGKRQKKVDGEKQEEKNKS